MILRTILFLILLYILVKVISRLFLPSSKKQQRSGTGFFYTTRNPRSDTPGQRSNKKHLEDIEEAEFEDITEEAAEDSEPEEK